MKKVIPAVLLFLLLSGCAAPQLSKKRNINYRLLQLCCFINLWGPGYTVESHDLKHGKDIFDLPDDYGKNKIKVEQKLKLKAS
jgi:hypothetical protein